MNRKKCLFLMVCVCALLALALRLFVKPTSAKLTSTNGSYDAIEAYVEEQIQRLNIPGVSLAIVEGDQIIHLRGFGKAQPGGEAPSPQTPFVLGSTTKAFTALAVMQLVKVGKIELDAPYSVTYPGSASPIPRHLPK